MSDDKETATGAVSPAIAETVTPKPEKVEEKTEKTEDAAASEDVERRKSDGGFQRRVNKLTKQIHERDRQLAETETRLKALETKLSNPNTDDRKLNPADFATWEDFEKAEEARLEKRIKAKIEADREEENRKKTEDEQRQAKRKAYGEYEAKVKAAKDVFEDIEDALEAVRNDDVPLSATMAEYLVETAEEQAALTHWLYSNPDEAERISKFAPIAAARALARIEAGLVKPQRKEADIPSPPRTLKGSGGGSSKNPETMSIDDHRAASKTRRIVDY